MNHGADHSRTGRLSSGSQWETRMWCFGLSEDIHCPLKYTARACRVLLRCAVEAGPCLGGNPRLLTPGAMEDAGSTLPFWSILLSQADECRWFLTWTLLQGIQLSYVELRR